MADWVRPPVPELALDLGTGLTRLAQRGGGLLVEQPSASAAAWSHGALALEECLERPVVHGVVADLRAAAQLLAPHLRFGRGASLARPRVLVCHPSDASAAERELLVEAALLAGAGAVSLVPEPAAAARALPRGGASRRQELVVDLGEGVTDIAVVQADRLLATAAFRTGLAEMRESVRQAVLQEHDVALREAEVATLLEAPARAAEDSGWLGVARLGSSHGQERGRRVLRRLLLVRSAVVACALERALDAIERAALSLLDSLGRRERERVARAGVLVTGGGALIAPLREGIGRRLGLDVRLPARPLHAVVLGARALLETGPRLEWRSS